VNSRLGTGLRVASSFTPGASGETSRRWARNSSGYECAHRSFDCWWLFGCSAVRRASQNEEFCGDGGSSGGASGEKHRIALREFGAPSSRAVRGASLVYRGDADSIADSCRCLEFHRLGSLTTSKRDGALSRVTRSLLVRSGTLGVRLGAHVDQHSTFVHRVRLSASPSGRRVEAEAKRQLRPSVRAPSWRA